MSLSLVTLLQDNDLTFGSHGALEMLQRFEWTSEELGLLLDYLHDLVNANNDKEEKEYKDPLDLNATKQLVIKSIRDEKASRLVSLKNGLSLITRHPDCKLYKKEILESEIAFEEEFLSKETIIEENQSLHSRMIYENERRKKMYDGIVHTKTIWLPDLEKKRTTCDFTFCLNQYIQYMELTMNMNVLDICKIFVTYSEHIGKYV